MEWGREREQRGEEESRKGERREEIEMVPAQMTRTAVKFRDRGVLLSDGVLA